MKEKEISRQEFDDLKNDAKDLFKVFDRINSKRNTRLSGFL